MMWFRNKKKEDDLTKQIMLLEAEVINYKTENSALANKLVEIEVTTDKKHERKEDFIAQEISLCINVTEALSIIREKSAINTQELFDKQSKLCETSKLFSQSTMLLDQIKNNVERLNSSTETSVSAVQKLNHAK